MTAKNDHLVRSFLPNINDRLIAQQHRSIYQTSLIFLLLYIMCISSLKAQTEEQIIRDQIEDLVEINVDAEESEVLNSLQNLTENPIDLNKDALQPLVEYSVISENQLHQLSDHIQKNGRLISIYELQAIAQFDLEDIQKLLPFVKVNSVIDDRNLTVRQLLLEGNYQLIFRFQSLLQQQSGHQDSVAGGYLGDRTKLFARFRYQNGGDLSYGITAEKDAGEQFFQGAQKFGFDFYSLHFFIRDLGPFKTLAVGDYDIKLGQGLIAWSGFGFGKGSNVMAIKKTGRHIRPYTSINENQFKRGIAASIDFNSIDLTAFLSYKAIDANILEFDSVENKAISVSSILLSGLHRTELEAEDKRNLKEWIFGGSVGIENRRWNLALNSINTIYNATLSRNLSLYNQFAFTGKKLHNVSLDYGFRFQNINLFGELAFSNNKGFAMLNGLLINLDKAVDLSILHRIYRRNFQSLYSNAFGESSNPNNENGLYIGILIKPIKHITINSYIDIYRHPWIKFRTDAPSTGRDILTQISFKPSKKLEIYLKYKVKVEDQNAVLNTNHTNHTEPIKKQNFRIHLTHKTAKSVTLSTRFEWSVYSAESDSHATTGYQIYQTINFRPLSFPVSFSARYSMFQSQSNNSKIYAYENDILGSTSVPSFIGTGSRFYIMTKFKVGRHFDIWLRYSLTRFPGTDVVTTTSSLSANPGKNAISGDKVEEVKMQLRLKF